MIVGILRRLGAAAGFAVAALALLVGSAAQSSPAVVPSTADGIHLWFGMQGNMSATQAEAVAAASAGDMVSALPVQIHRYGAAMKAANPNVRLFAYQNGMFSQSKDCSTFPASWYLYTARGAKVQAAKTGNCLMNPLSTQVAFGAAGWTQYVEQQCASALSDPHTSGCFLDQMNAAPLGSGFVNGAPIDPRTGQPFTNTAYMQLVAAHGQRVASELGAPVAGNAYDSAPRYYSIPTSIVNQASGIVVDEAEHWFGNDVMQSRVLSAWQQAVQMEIDSQAAGHGPIVNVDGPGSSPEQWRSYITASYMLGNNGSAWLEFGPSGNISPYDSLSPLYDLPVGTPTETHSTVAGYAVGGYYRRDYTHGMVLVNPTGSTVSVALGGTYVDVTGQSMTSISLPAWSGAVLVSNGSSTPPVAPANTVAPSISGTPAAGSTLTASAGTWTGTPNPTLKYQWQRCDASDVCSDVAGSTGTTYAVSDADSGTGLRVEVTGTNTAGSAFADSPVVTVQASSPPVAPSNTSAPSVSGTGQVGSALTASPGTWTGTPDPTLGYQWQRCDASGVCGDVGGSTGRTYAVTTADEGSSLRVVVTGTNTAGAASADSPAVTVSASQGTSLISAVSVSGTYRRHRISFTLTGKATVSVTIVNASGVVVRHRLTGVTLAAGTHTVRWGRRNDAGARVPSGDYWAVITAVAGGTSSAKRSSAMAVR